jgi:phosphoglycerate dehydrogenase-like enzyme
MQIISRNGTRESSRIANIMVLCSPALLDDVFPMEILAPLKEMEGVSLSVVDPGSLAEVPETLSTVEVILTTWGMPVLAAEFLEAAPCLRAVFYAAGSVKPFATEAAWEREITISSAWEANGVLVAEYALGVILLSLKRFWHFSRGMRSPHPEFGEMKLPGAYRSSVGLVSLGAAGRATARLLRHFEVSVLAYDPFVHPEEASRLGVELVSLQEIFRRCDVVSLHSPWIRETEGMITGPLVASMKEGATLINTSRGAIIAESELIEVLRQRPDLSAVLDVTHPEPPSPDSPLRSLPNVVLTPHIAGSLQKECARMGQAMIDEIRRYLAGEPLQHSLTRNQLAGMA